MKRTAEAPAEAGADHGEAMLIALRRVMRAVDLHSKRLLQSHGLTGPQLVLLKELALAGDCTVGDLAGRVRLSQATVTEILMRLERRGLVERRRSAQDRRCVLNSLSAAGRRILAAAPPLLQESFTARFTALEPREQLQLLAALERLAALMDAGDIDAAPLLSSGGLTDDPAASDGTP